jgi:hypothetical protein
MTAWKWAIAVVPWASEKGNALFVADRAFRLDPKLVPALTLKAKLAMAGFRLDLGPKP